MSYFVLLIKLYLFQSYQGGVVAIRYIDEDRSIVLKKADKGSCVEFSDSDDYVSEAGKQISDKAIYKNV